MSWVKLDDNFFTHPKVVAVGAEASGLYVWALAYCSRHLTDGRVPRGWVQQAVGRRTTKLAELLVEQGLWEENGTGWLVHDYLDYQPTRDAILAKRQRDSERKARG